MIDSGYKEEHYFTETTNGQKLKKFEHLLADLTANGVIYHKFQNRKDVFNFIYQIGKSNNEFVWLSQGVNHDGRGISNNLSKIYKYLINSRLIDNNSLR